MAVFWQRHMYFQEPVSEILLLMYAPKNSNGPLTKTRLNFYLAQRARHAVYDSNTNSPYIDRSRSRISPSQHQENNSSIFGASVKSIIDNNQDHSQPKSNHNYSIDSAREESVLGSPRPGILRQSPIKQHGVRALQKDSLDSLMSRNNRHNMVQSERVRECNTPRSINFFDHQNSSVLSKQNHLPIDWRREPKKTERTNVYFREMDSNFRNISQGISSLTYELNRNNKKLDEFTQLQSPKKMPDKQLTLKRVNFKHSQVDAILRLKAQETERVPRVEYYDRSYHDPRYLIWNPLH